MEITYLPAGMLNIPSDIQEAIICLGGDCLTPEQYVRLLLHGNLALIHASQQPQYRGHVLELTLVFQNQGEKQLGFLWCFNPTAPEEPVFWRVFSSVLANPDNHICTYDQMRADRLEYIMRGRKPS